MKIAQRLSTISVIVGWVWILAFMGAFAAHQVIEFARLGWKIGSW